MQILIPLHKFSSGSQKFSNSELDINQIHTRNMLLYLALHMYTGNTKRTYNTSNPFPPRGSPLTSK